MKSISSVVVFVFLLAPQIASAGWWNPTSWFSVENQVKEQRQPQNSTSSSTPLEVPMTSIKTADAKTIEALRVEVATLKTKFDNLEKRFSNLQKSTPTQPTLGESDVSQRIAALEKRVDAFQTHDTSRLTKLEQKVAELTNVSTNAVSTQAKNYDSQISEMAKRINALMHGWTINDGYLLCGTQTDLKSFPPPCARIYADLNY